MKTYKFGIALRKPIANRYRNKKLFVWCDEKNNTSVTTLYTFNNDDGYLITQVTHTPDDCMEEFITVEQFYSKISTEELTLFKVHCKKLDFEIFNQLMYKLSKYDHNPIEQIDVLLEKLKEKFKIK